MTHGTGPQPAGETAPLLELRGICKRFGGVQALDGVSFSVHPGEVHVLLGENGAGKSTLIKVLCGAHVADEGSFVFQGAPKRVQKPADAQALGVAVIFQEFSLVPYLDIAHNIFLGREFRRRYTGLLDKPRLYAQARRVLEDIGFEIDPHTAVHTLGVAQQQMVEIAKALSQNARILVMDEPTAALSDRESQQLFAMIRRLQARGVAIVYISHRMEEVVALGDRVTVLRDGRQVASLLRGGYTVDSLIQAMVGRSVDVTYPRTFQTPGPKVLEVRGLASAAGIRDIDLDVRAGEIVGLCGLVGAGRTEVARAIFGADRITAGEVWIDGRRKLGGPEQADAFGIALIPEGRKTEGLAMIRTIEDNLVSAGLRRIFANGLFQPARARQVAEELIRKLQVSPALPQRPVRTLSGGNQQKVVIGKWLVGGTRLYIFDEPTRGVDIGAKAEIFALMDQLAAQGAAILMISSEQMEIVHVCDRAYVMRDRRIVGELPRSQLTEKNIVDLGVQHG